jgi:hypothetical protein
LTIVARDSKHSRAKAKAEFTATQKECSRNQKKRDAALSDKRKQLLKIESGQPHDTDTSGKIQPSLSSHHSQLRSRVNKQIREKREERYRQLTAIHQRIREQLGTNEPKAIEELFIERRETSETLHRQIEDLQRDREEIKIQISKMQGAIEEQEFTTASGAGVQRMTAEGAKIVQSTKKELRTSERQMEAFQTHQKEVFSGIAHLIDLLSLVTPDQNKIPKNFPSVMDWVIATVTQFQKAVVEEDISYTELVNPQVFMSYCARESRPEGEVKKPTKRLDLFKRSAREQKGDVQTRVLDRAAVKAAAQRYVQQAQPQKRTARK